MNAVKIKSNTETMNNTLTEGKFCPNCQGRMELAVGEYPVGDAFDRNWFHVDVYYCPACGQQSFGGPMF